MTSWLAFLATLSLIILVHECGHFVMARWIGVKVERFSFGFGPRLIRRVSRGTEYVLSLLPFGGYVKLAGEVEESTRPAKPWEYRARSVVERCCIVLAGPLINYALGFLLFLIVFLVGAPVLSTGTRIGEVIKDYPAAQAGLREGDRVLAVSGKPVESWEEMTRAIQAQTASVSLLVEREGKQFQQVLQPKVLERTNTFGVKVHIGIVGIQPSTEFRRYPPVQAFWEAGTQVCFLTTMTLRSLWQIAIGGLSIRESLTGPIGIFQITSAVAERGLVPLLHLIAVLSTSIGLFNLLPIPVLDGGHLAFLGVEKLRGRPVSLRVQEAMTRVGLGLLLLLLAVVTYNDFVRLEVGSRLWSLFGKG